MRRLLSARQKARHFVTRGPLRSHHGEAGRRQCSICSSSQLTIAPRIEGYQLHRCGACSHLFVSEEIDAGVLARAYDEPYFQVDATSDSEGYGDYVKTLEKRIRGFRDWYAPLTEVIGTPGRSLDFGCAVGAMVKAAQDCGWDAVGYERSAWAATYGRERLGVTIVTGDGQVDPFEPSSFDLVTMWDVIEHVERPNDIIALVARWLKPGGWLAINTVDAGSWGARLAGARWRHFDPPRHLHYFTRQSLRRLLDAHGFDVRMQRANGVMLEAKLRHSPLGYTAALVEAGVTHWRMRPLANLLNLKDEVEVLARKR